MNAKKAKALRRILKNLENSSPEAAKKMAEETRYNENTQNRKMIKMEVLDDEGNPVTKAVPIASGTVTMDPKSKRSLYKTLKKAMGGKESPAKLGPASHQPL